MKKLLTCSLCLIILLAMLISGCSSSPSDSSPTTSDPSSGTEKTEENTFVYGVIADAVNLMPTELSTDVEHISAHLIYDMLFNLNDEGDLEGVLAESWGYEDDLTYTVKIRDNVYFSNGEKMTADDVLFTLQTLVVSGVYSSVYQMIDIDNCKLLDELTIQIKLKEVSASFEALLTLDCMAIMSRSVYDEIGGDAYMRNPIGSGAFILEEWLSGDRLIYKRNENYWGPLPESETIILRVIV
jgi:peptide/nickel transport system substrate-binding protein